jgi:hypothetical protein
MNTSIADVENGRIQDVLREANRLWRRRSVRGVDRAELLDELEAELAGAQRDGHGLNMVLGDDASQTVRQLADERRLSGRALRLGLVVPASFVGMVAGLAVVLLLVFGGFSNRWSFDPGPFVLPLYASAGLLAYLCALLCVWFVLRNDPHAPSTVRWLAALLPVGAVLGSGAGIAVAWWRNFNTSSTVFGVVIGVVFVVLGATVGLARYQSVRSLSDL